MMGTGDMRGMIPLSLEQIFRSVGDRDALGWRFSIQVSARVAPAWPAIAIASSGAIPAYRRE
eukprot:2005122-Pyramimonas_sp.AAC.1